MSKKKKMVPQLRFPGFSGEWEERKLGVVANYRNGKAHENDIDEKGKYVVVNSKFVSTNGKVRKFSNKQNEPLFKNELAFVLSDVPNGKAIARTFLIDKDDKYTLNQRIAGIKPLENTNPYYLYILMNRHRYFLQFDDGAKQTNLTKEDVERFSSFYPLKAEQDRIGIYFEQLDHLIALQQRQLTHLQTRKKGLLQKMFPKDGELFPELRFPGFTDAWEQRQLSEVAEQTFGGGTPKTSVDEYWSGEIPWIQSSDLTDGKVYGVVPNKTISEAGLNNSATKLIPANSIALITRVGVGKLSFMPFSYATSQDFLSLSSLKIDPWFCVYSCYKKLQSELHVVQGTSIKGITKDELLAKKIPVPVKEEQAKIGAFFKQLDDSITLHQRKLDHLQARKKALLQQMFV